MVGGVFRCHQQSKRRVPPGVRTSHDLSNGCFRTMKSDGQTDAHRRTFGDGVGLPCCRELCILLIWERF